MLRPLKHFTPLKNWMNDPNGLIFYKGEYHLFYQHNPYGNNWGHMSWGHASSKDLVIWKHLPIAIPENPNYAIFSGSVVHDEPNNRLVAIYTAHRSGNQSQHLAFSYDDGKTWEDYSANPVLDINSAQFRDPKVFKYQDKWLMVVVKAHEETCVFYVSENLINWKYLSEFKGEKLGLQWECPDLFNLDGKWVLIFSVNEIGTSKYCGMKYYIGNFDGKNFFTKWKSSKIFDYGPDCFAGVTFNNSSERIMIAWMNNWLYANEANANLWNGSMTIPRKLKISQDRITQEFIVESGTYNVKRGISYFSYPEGNLILNLTEGFLYISRAEIWTGDLTEFKIPISKSEISISALFDSGSIELNFEGISFTARLQVGTDVPEFKQKLSTEQILN